MKTNSPSFSPESYGLLVYRSLALDVDLLIPAPGPTAHTQERRDLVDLSVKTVKRRRDIPLSPVLPAEACLSLPTSDSARYLPHWVDSYKLGKPKLLENNFSLWS